MTDSAPEPRLVSAEAVPLLSVLRDGIPRTRAELAAMTGLARSTIASRIDGLIANRLVMPAADAVSTGGRPPSRVVFSPAGRLILGIDLGATHGVVALHDLAGDILSLTSRTLRIADGPAPILDWAIEAARLLVLESGRPVADLIGIGIGLPAPVEHSSGRPVSPPIMPGWDRFDVAGYVREAIALPVLVDNDVNLLALGEQAIVWPDQSDLLFVKVATGIGAGIISNGRVLRGAQGSAGDLGHVHVPFTQESTRRSAAEADLEALASGPAIAASLTAAGIPAETSDDVIDAVRSGNPVVLEVIRQAGRDLGEVVATCVNLLNPSVVVIGGSIARVGEHLIAGVRETVYQRSTPLATQHLTITQSQAGAMGGVKGAALMVAQNALGPDGRPRTVS